jgi:fructose-specific phosphotransferase system IIA component
MKLLNYLDRSSIDLDLKGQTKEQVLSELVSLLVSKGFIKNGETLYESLLEREGLGSTGIGHGVAIPHGRCPEVAQPAIVFGRTREAIDFDAIDGQPSRLFFLLVAPENGSAAHLHLLAKIARLVKHAETRERLLTTDSPDQVLELIQGQDGT